ncbi:MAG: hypothetical protein NC218_04430 [Acetobacter sp.]|nr:hypothetical protein [Acetobacter sp.]
MTNPMKTAVDSLFKRLGKIARYKNQSIRIILTEPDEVVGIGFVNTHSPTHRGRIRVSDAPELKVGDKIETEDETFAVYSEPVLDIHRLVWSCDLVCV